MKTIATSLLARGEFALILAAMATSAGLDGRLSSFTAGYVLALAVLGPVMAGRVNWLVRILTVTAALSAPRNRRADATAEAEPDPDDDEPEAALAAAAHGGLAKPDSPPSARTGAP